MRMAAARCTNMNARSKLTRKYILIRPYLDHRQLYLWAAVEAESTGKKGIALVASVTGVSRSMISRWITEVRATALAPADGLPLPRMSRRVGRKFTEVNDPGIEAALEGLVTDEVAGDQ
jgi:hypothetical protein